MIVIGASAGVAIFVILKIKKGYYKGGGKEKDRILKMFEERDREEDTR